MDEQTMNFYARLERFLTAEAMKRLPNSDLELTYVQEYSKGQARLVFFFSEKKKIDK